MRRILPGLTVLALLMGSVAVFAVQSGRASNLEAVGFVSGALAVYLASREHVLNWPVGLLTSVTYAVFFFEGKLFADAWLQVVYFVLGLLGWYWWVKGREGQELEVSRAKPTTWIALGGFFVGFLVISTWYLYRVHGAAPAVDAFVTTGSLVGQYLLMRKHLESWLVWIVVDIVYVPLFLWKGWYLTAGLYVIYLVLAVIGMREWSQSSGIRLVEAKVTAALLAIGAVASGWIGYRCWQFEQLFGEWLTAVRWSDGAAVASRKLNATEFMLLKADVCDPLNVEYGVEPGPDGPVIPVVFISADGQTTPLGYGVSSSTAQGVWGRVKVRNWGRRILKSSVEK